MQSDSSTGQIVGTDSKQQQPPLLLEDKSRDNDDNGGPVHRLDMSSGKASITLGPIVVNEDGKLVVDCVRTIPMCDTYQTD